MNIELETQKAIRARLIADPAVTDLVPAASILDRNQRPNPSPAILLGEVQSVDDGSSLKRLHTRVYHSIHVWKREPSTEGVKEICGAIRSALRDGRLTLGPGLHAADLKVSGIRILRDPDGETSHGIVTVELLIGEAAP